MLPKVNRLKREKDIEKVFKEGKAFKEDFLILKVVENGLRSSRFAFIVPQKVSKKATLRNKIKRRLSESVRIKMKNIKTGRDVILLAISGAEKKDFWEIEETLNKLFVKAKIYHYGTNN